MSSIENKVAAVSLAQMVAEWVDEGTKLGTDWRPGLAEVIEKRLERLNAIFIHVTPKCEPHDFGSWRAFEDGRGGEQVCKKCGIGAMSDSLRNGI